MMRMHVDKRFCRVQIEIEVARGSQVLHKYDGMLQTKVQKVRRKRLFGGLDIHAGSSGKELLLCERGGRLSRGERTPPASFRAWLAVN
jgi:hypothetical protein